MIFKAKTNFLNRVIILHINFLVLVHPEAVVNETGANIQAPDDPCI